MLPSWFTSIYYDRDRAQMPMYFPLKMWYPPSMRDTFDLIRDYCGEVCDTTIGPLGQGKYFDAVEKHIDCDRLFSDDFIEGWEQSIYEAPPVLESLVLASFIFIAFILDSEKVWFSLNMLQIVL